MNAVRTYLIYSAAAVLVGGLGFWFWPADKPGAAATATTVNVPELTGLSAFGKAAFDKVCAACHGANGAGTDKGPPFVHDIYNPGHHPDEAFFRAARLGVPQHHWPYGDMPPQPEVGEYEVRAIVQYVRALQRANGIIYRPHQM
jgi:mono/diheme cytochrome c family protein